jgi:glucose/arabinose dehydrogenase
MTRRAALAIAAVLASIAAIAAALNPGGLRARVVARFLRVDNHPTVLAPPAGFAPTVPPGFHVSVFAAGFATPRWLAVAPNGDLFVADSASSEVVLLTPRGGAVGGRRIFADHLNMPFGIAFRDGYVYVANTNEVVRFPFDPATSARRGAAEHLLDLPGLGYNQHWTRSLAFSADGRRLFVSVGSKTNVSIESDPRRAAIVMSDPDGRGARVYASGLRNAVGVAVNPVTGALWATVNERDDVGDDQPPDFFTHVVEGGFYGWPYSYLGAHVDNRVSSHPDLVAKALVPDAQLGAHVAALQFVFYEGGQFPQAYRGGAFIAEHGSWNSRTRRGYQVIFVPFRDGMPAGEPTAFLSGLVPDLAGANVYGRPVGVAVGGDGSLFVSDDGAKVIWRVSYERP